MISLEQWRVRIGGYADGEKEEGNGHCSHIVISLFLLAIITTSSIYPAPAKMGISCKKLQTNIKLHFLCLFPMH